MLIKMFTFSGYRGIVAIIISTYKKKRFSSNDKLASFHVSDLPKDIANSFVDKNSISSYVWPFTLLHIAASYHREDFVDSR